MSPPGQPPPGDEAEEFPLSIRSYFVRGRNALLARGDFSGLFVEFYLHLPTIGQRFEEEDDVCFKELLAAAALHASTRPGNETAAWTVHRPEPPANFFVNVSNPAGSIVGTIYNENIPAKEHGVFYSDVVAGSGPARRSVVDFEGSPGFAAAQRFIEKSDQRTARFFCHHDEDYVLLVAQPDCDEEWLRDLRPEEIPVLDRHEQLSLLEVRNFRWLCGCSMERMLGVLKPLMARQGEALFDGGEAVTIRCPRCGAKYRVSRGALEAASAREF